MLLVRGMLAAGLTHECMVEAARHPGGFQVRVKPRSPIWHMPGCKRARRGCLQLGPTLRPSALRLALPLDLGFAVP